VIWREEVQWLERLSDDAIEDVLDVHPILAREVIRQPTSEAVKQLKAIAGRMPEMQSIVIRPDGTAWHGTIYEALAIQPSILNFATVILPAKACSLRDGFLDGGFDGNPAKDVADADGSRCRVILTRSDTGWTMRRLGLDDDSEHDVPEDYEANVRSITKMRIVADIPLDDDEGDQERRLIYLARAPTDLIGPLAYAYAIEEQSLDEHNMRVATVAKELAERLGLPSLVPIYEMAGKRHDLGKNSPIWQRAIGNNGTIVLAKTAHARFDGRINAGFRHEFGSLMQSDSCDMESPDDDGHLISHLIAAHHGYGRPHFPNRSFDRSMPIQKNQEMAGNVMRDFAALTRKHGWWGLAYIESVLKASDMLVSVGLDKGDEP
jgi:CRISPR-associated endonuclease/helicase Cas3